MNATAVTTPSRYEIAAWIVAACLLLLTLQLRLLPALLAGLLVYELVHVIAVRLPLIRGTGSKLTAIGLIATAVVVALVLAFLGVVAFVQSDAGSLARRACCFRIFQKPTRLRPVPRALRNSRGDAPRFFSSAGLPFA